ncbi:MFS transporter [uncultured Maritimibacter sp.]|jgi:MFS family permease|uniref:MFS transporter n=1 Tax=uncultured Maritimibacter sp. TaxID=991866 RepID=UPI0026326E69|nr:MFS transporter [uncultured Maritimibacter sp.]
MPTAVGTAQPVTDPSPRALAYPAFRRYYIGAVCGTNGGWITRILLSWLAWDLTRSATFVGVIAMTSLLPVAFFGPIFGAIVDRMSIRVAMARVAMFLVTIPAILLVLVWAGVLTPLTLFLLAATFGTVMSAYHPIRQSLGPRLVEPPAIGSVVALGALNFNVGRLFAPAVGGAMIGAWGVIPAAVLGVLMALPNALIARTLEPREHGVRAEGGFRADLAEGFRVVWQRWPIRRSILLAVAALGLIRGIAEILTLVADGQFGMGARGLGLLTSAVGGGALVAAVFQIFAGERLLRQRGLRFAVIAVGFAGVLGMAHAPNFAFAMVAATLVGFTSTYVGVSLQIGLQARLEDELRGRVMSIWMLANTAATALAAFALSGLTDWIGLPLGTTYVTIACGIAVTLLWLWPTERD